MCDRLHNDPNDRVTNFHIASCYAAYEEYWDRDGLVSEGEFDAMTTEEKLADLAEWGDSVCDDSDAEKLDICASCGTRMLRTDLHDYTMPDAAYLLCDGCAAHRHGCRSLAQLRIAVTA